MGIKQVEENKWSDYINLSSELSALQVLKNKCAQSHKPNN